MKINYIPKNFAAKTIAMIHEANYIIEEFQAQGFDLTLRQLYYQLVARDLFPDDRRFGWTGKKWVKDEHGTKNAFPNYKWLGGILNDARLAGVVDWDAIVDRTRVLKSNPHWNSPHDILEAVSKQYLENRWENQPIRPEVWIEKDALVGVIAGICTSYDVPYFSCRGYSSQSAMHEAGAGRIDSYAEHGQRVLIIHLADHDPSGIHMTKDIRDRLGLFAPEADLTVHRVALTMEQVETFNPPPNPAKTTDSRAAAYIEEYGDESWELDALPPAEIVALIEHELDQIIDPDTWDDDDERIKAHREDLRTVARNYEKVVAFAKDL